MLRTPPAWWNWRNSARASVVAFIELWAMIFVLPILGPLLGPIVAIRFVVSTGHLYLNWMLNRVAPIERRSRADWLLFGLTYVAACTAAAIGRSTGDMRSPLLLMIIAVPYSGIELRAIARQYRAAARAELAHAPVQLRTPEFTTEVPA